MQAHLLDLDMQAHGSASHLSASPAKVSSTSTFTQTLEAAVCEQFWISLTLSMSLKSAMNQLVSRPTMERENPSNNSMLSELLDDALSSFSYVRFGPTFLSEFQYDQLRLDGAKLLLSRWGQAAGLAGAMDRSATRAPPITNHSKVEQSLKQILKLFAKGEREFYNSNHRADTDALRLQEHMDETGRSLHGKLDTLVAGRRSNQDIRPKKPWVLNETEEYESFLGHIVNQISVLMGSIPIAQRPLLRGLCEGEVSEIGAKESLHMLQGIAAAQDRDLADAISRALQSTAPAIQSWNYNTHNSKVAAQTAGTNYNYNYAPQHLTFN